MSTEWNEYIPKKNRHSESVHRRWARGQLRKRWHPPWWAGMLNRVGCPSLASSGTTRLNPLSGKGVPRLWGRLHFGGPARGSAGGGNFTPKIFFKKYGIPALWSGEIFHAFFY
jgi:hypothetical protein